MSIVVENLVVRYGAKRRPAVDGVSATLAVPGAVTVLIGPNASGKSTLVRAVAQAVRIERGVITIGADDARRLSARALASHLAFAPQETPVPFAFTVSELIGLGATAIVSRETNDADERIARAVDALDLSDLLTRNLLTLSGGERQRAAVARALAQDAPYLLLDEPTAHLDPGHQTRLLAALRNEARTNNKAVLVVLHDLSLAGQWADRLLLLDQGRLVAHGAPAEVLTQELLDPVYQTRLAVYPSPLTGRPRIEPVADAHKSVV